jgi:hypothetical protein
MCLSPDGAITSSATTSTGQQEIAPGTSAAFDAQSFGQPLCDPSEAIVTALGYV